MCSLITVAQLQGTSLNLRQEVHCSSSCSILTREKLMWNHSMWTPDIHTHMHICTFVVHLVFISYTCIVWLRPWEGRNIHTALHLSKTHCRDSQQSQRMKSCIKISLKLWITPGYNGATQPCFHFWTPLRLFLSSIFDLWWFQKKGAMHHLVEFAG